MSHKNVALLLSLSALLAGGMFTGGVAVAQPAFRGSQVRTLPIAAALANKDRPEADRAADATRKPAELLAFAGMARGMRVADLMPGQGYFTRIFSNIVGKTGHVYTVVSAERVAQKPDAANAVKAIAADPSFANVSEVTTPITALTLPGLVDMAWTSQNYHDVYGQSPESALAFDKAVFRILRPGGVYIVIDHVATAGSGSEAPKTLHRIDPALIRDQVTKAGFVFESESAALKNPSDPHTATVFDPSVRGRTDQVVFKFRKPGR
ncbi:class I SAM-dependent methyltransferase [Acetobacter fallax]|uniref:class I SAM-dependent methyltransferase n=1 Tax=Acetobacter fallax TaxID=1737473 RepID=UPI0030D29387